VRAVALLWKSVPEDFLKTMCLQLTPNWLFHSAICPPVAPGTPVTGDRRPIESLDTPQRAGPAQAGHSGWSRYETPALGRETHQLYVSANPWAFRQDVDAGFGGSVRIRQDVSTSRISGSPYRTHRTAPISPPNRCGLRVDPGLYHRPQRQHEVVPCDEWPQYMA
jgi:hypothetical protein